MRMLVIDDESDICDIIAELGMRRGLDVKTISNPELVASTLLSFEPDFIILDLMMPGMDGVELLRTLAENIKSSKLCLMSGSDTRVLNSARRLGSAHGLDVVAALEKPLNLSALGSLLDLVAEGSGKKDSVDLTHAITTGQFTLHYQPVIEMATKRVKGVEALARWKHPQRGLLLPDAFLEQVIDDGLMQALTDMVVETSVIQAAKWHAAGEDLTVSMNVTASTLLDLSLPDKISELCKLHNVPPQKLILEVTETEAMKDVTRTMDVLLRMRIRNIGVSIDDFGTGHSSLRELQRMPFSELKIDRSFVSDMATNKDSAVIVNSIIDLASNLGLKIIAEGVEEVKCWRMLQDRGCHFAQGFLMGRPMHVSDFDGWLHKWRTSPAV